MDGRRRVDVPTRLYLLLTAWDQQDRPAQPGIGWNHATWSERLPAHRELFDRLPNPIDRSTAQAHVQHANRAGRYLEAFVAAMVWGYGGVGYGPYRTARVLTSNPPAAAIFRKIARLVGQDSGPDAFAWLASHRLKWLGVAFATKYLFFCHPGDGTRAALVLDSLVSRWLHQHADLRIRLTWRVDDYRRYIDTVTGWAEDLKVTPADVEYLMFADAVAARSRSQWTGSFLVPPR
jgi:hypothetical protein